MIYSVVAGCLAGPTHGQGLRGASTRTQQTVLATLTVPQQVAKTVDVTVSGKVTDEKGAGLPGVSVIVKGSTQGTTTDGEGDFRISAPNTASILVFSFVGYQRQEVVIGNQSTISITLAPDDQTLSEVVVVGYGSQRRQDITSAVSVISMRDIGEQPANNPNQILQGRAPGVVVKQKSGAPGGVFEVRIRGIGSLGAGSNPLYVIDGFVVGTSVGQNLNPTISRA